MNLDALISGLSVEYGLGNSQKYLLGLNICTLAPPPLLQILSLKIIHIKPWNFFKVINIF